MVVNMQLILGCLATAISLFAFLTALVPRWRGSAFWKGSSVRCGPIASLGFAAIFGTVALFLFAEESIGEQHRGWLVLVLIAALIMVFAGQAFDVKRKE